MRERQYHTNLKSGYSTPTVARMITGQIALEAVEAGPTQGFRRINKSRGLGGNNTQQVVDVLKGRDRPDSRPPGICKDCFTAWSRSSRPKLIICPHRRVAAIRRGGSWAVASSLTPEQLQRLSNTKVSA